MQSAFVDVGLERDAFLYVTDFLEEQEEDSEELDTNGGGGRKPREPREAREPRESREPREQRSRPQENGGEMSAAEVPAPRGDRDRGRDQDRGDQGGDGGSRRWQGRRGRRFGGRGPRSDQRSDRSEPRSEQRSLESPEIVEEAISAEPVARPERGAPGGVPAQNLPIVLPGESLSKYGGRTESRSSAPAASTSRPAPARASTFKPSTMVEVPTDWDGGATLPGETLSRHRRSESRAGSSQPASTENWAAEPAVATAAPEESSVAVAPVPESLPVENLEIAAPPVPETAVSHSQPVEHAAEAVALHASEIETVEEVHEYEPEDASASHRVESPRSEFRFASPEVEVEEVVE
jgi:Ribonuclease G/E